MLDDIDRRLLRQLQSDPALPLNALATRARVTGQMAARRLDKLRTNGVLKGSRVMIDWRELGFEVEVSLRVTLDKTQRNAFDEFLAEARQVPEVIEIQTFLGRVDVRLSVIARDLAHYQDIYRRRLLTLPHIADVEALMRIATVKSDTALPL